MGTLHFLTALGAFLATLSAVSALSSFNCTLNKHPCHPATDSTAGMCDTNTGMCQCFGTNAGYDCGLPSNSQMTGACLQPGGNTCQNGGTCYDIQGMANCYCPPEYYGQSCEWPAVQNECTADSMVVNVNPGSHFTGQVFIKTATPSTSATPTCQLGRPSYSDYRSSWRGFSTVLPYAGAPCGAKPLVNDTLTDTTYTYEIAVRYNPLDTTSDDIATFTCTVPKGGPSPTAPMASAVFYSLKDMNGNLVTSPKLGSNVIATFDVDPTSIFTDLSIQECRVWNRMKTKSKLVVENGCPKFPFGKTLVKQGTSHVLTLRAMTFGRERALDFDCDIKVCKSTDTSCQIQPVCPTLPALNAPGKGQGSQGQGSQGPGSQFPGSQIPGSQFPGSQFPGSQFPTSQFPGSQFPNDPNAPALTPGGSPSTDPFSNSFQGPPPIPTAAATDPSGAAGAPAGTLGGIPGLGDLGGFSKELLAMIDSMGGAAAGPATGSGSGGAAASEAAAAASTATDFSNLFAANGFDLTALGNLNGGLPTSGGTAPAPSPAGSTGGAGSTSFFGMSTGTGPAPTSGSAPTSGTASTSGTAPSGGATSPTGSESPINFMDQFLAMNSGSPLGRRRRDVIGSDVREALARTVFY